MNKRNLDALIAMLVIGGALAGICLVAWLVHIKAPGGDIAAVSTLVGLLLNMSAGVVRNRFPGPEIDVVPHGYTQGGGCTCGKDSDA